MFFLMMRSLRIYSLNNFQIYHKQCPGLPGGSDGKESACSV